MNKAALAARRSDLADGVVRPLGIDVGHDHVCPRPAKGIAVARPMPAEPPVTMATASRICTIPEPPARGTHGILLAMLLPPAPAIPRRSGRPGITALAAYSARAATAGLPVTRLADGAGVISFAGTL